MKIKNVTLAQLEAALSETNRKNGYQLTWNRSPESLNQKGTRWALTIRSRASRLPGARTAPSGRALVSASWHAHGYFFEEVLAQAPAAVIQTGAATITAQGGNWQDYRMGSMFAPCMASQLSVL